MELYEYSEGDINRLYPLGKKFSKDNKEQFIHLTEENYELREIAKKMGWDASYLGNLAKDLIVQEYDFIEQYRNKANKKQRAFGDLQFYLIGQKILRQVLVNTLRSEILECFEGGMTSDVFRSVQRRVLHAQSFSDLRDLARERLLNILILDLNPSKLSEISDDDRCWMPQGSIFKKLKQFYKDNPLVQRVLSKKHLQYLEMARVAVIGTELEKYYKMGLSKKLILRNLNNKYTLEDIIDITKLIWDCDPDTVMLMLHAGILKEK